MFSKTRVCILTTIFVATLVSSTVGQSINESLKITTEDSLPDDHFGFAVALNQNTVAIGAPDNDANGLSSGSAYLFNAATGVQVAKLLPEDNAAGDQFGFSIAISDGVVAVGAPRDADNGVTSGSAYLFDASTGIQLHKLTPADGDAEDEFGYSIDIDGGIVAVGALRNDDLGDSSGSAYLFDVSTGDQIEKLLPGEGAANQSFGVSVAIDDAIVAVGARTYFVPGEGFTLSKVFLFDAGSADQMGTLIPDNGTWTDFFADTIDIDNGLVAVGAWAKSIFFDHSGAAYVFDAFSGDQIQYIFPADGHDRDNFGISIAIDNGVVAIGAHLDDDNGFNSGSAYVFDAASGNQLYKLVASDGEVFDQFGSSIAIDGDRIAVGAVGDDGDTGSVYLFGEDVVLLGDINLDGLANLLDVGPFVNLLSNGSFQAEADMNQDGAVNLLDVDLFINAISG